MVIDYKDVSFSFRAQKRKKLMKRVRLAALVVLIIFVYLFISLILDSGKIKTVQTMLLENRRDEAAEKLKKSEGSLFHKKSKKELKALLCLFADDLTSGGEILTGLKTKSTSVDFQKFLDYFSNHAEYGKLKIYTRYLVERGEKVTFHEALYNTGLFDFKQSEAVLEKMTVREKEVHKQELEIIRKVNKQLKSGKINYIFDVNGLPMAYYDLQRKKTVPLAPGMSFEPFNEEFKQGLKFYSLTADLAVQEKLHQIFRRRKYRGTFLLLDLSDAGITAAYSKSYNGDKQNAVFSGSYEPGSIIKVLTLFCYLRSDSQDLFPYQCKGTCPINGKIFYDWFRHGTIKTFDEALAVSCNISFARMGLKLGIKKLGGTFDQFYFNGAGLRDRFLHFKTGTYKTKTADKYEIANLSVGLNDITITTFHSALLSAVIAQNGSIYAPHLIKNEKNLFNLGYYTHPSELLTVAGDSAVFLKIKNAMIRVVDDPRGTGRRSKVDFMRVGLKTGTSGSKKLGLDAVLIGFFPAEKPKYAFAFRLERVGKAELNGAYFLKDFLNAFYRKK
jgi:hypothetical protein